MSKNVFYVKNKKQKEKDDYKKSANYIWQCDKHHQLYCFTVKVTHNLKKANEGSYKKFFYNLFAKAEVICYCAEYSPKEVLHYHGSIKVPKNYYINKLRVSGYHLYLKKCNNFKNWTDYCFKNNLLYSYNSFTNTHLLI